MGPDGQNKTMMSNKKTKKMNFEKKLKKIFFEKKILFFFRKSDFRKKKHVPTHLATQWVGQLREGHVRE